MARQFWIGFFVFVLATSAKAEFGIGGGILNNTPFDPDTWRDTIRNTPVDPRTWPQAVDDLTDPLGVACTHYLNHKRETNVSYRGLTHTEKFYLRPWFGDLVDRVTVFWRASLNGDFKVGGVTIAVGSAAQTIGTTIYVAGERQTGSPEQLILLAHEMNHVWQYEQYNGSVRAFCRAYMDGYWRNGFDYANNPMERGSYDFEISFAQWLAKNHPNPNYLTRTYQTGSPYQRRTAAIPGWLVIPPQEYALTCITNKTSFTVNYNYWWGNDQPQKSTLTPGQVIGHYYPYPGGSRHSPNLNVKFDYTLNDNVSVDKSFMLNRFATTSNQCPGNGMPYHFWHRTDNNQLDLFASQ